MKEMTLGLAVGLVLISLALWGLGEIELLTVTGLVAVIIMACVFAVIGGGALAEAAMKILEPKRFWVITYGGEARPTLHLRVGITELPQGSGPGRVYGFPTYTKAADAWVKMEAEWAQTRRVEVH